MLVGTPCRFMLAAAGMVLLAFGVVPDLHARADAPMFPGVRFTERTLPPGCVSEGGTLLSGPGKRAVSQIRCAGTSFSVLSRMIEQGGRDGPRWQALDVVALPTLRQGQSVNDTDCSAPGTGYTLAVARWRHTKARSEAVSVEFALRVREGGERFERLDVRRVRCSFNDDRD